MLKGKTVIELTDVKTGQVERFEDENLVTNAVGYHLNAIITLQGMAGANYNMPAYKNTLGGIKLFENSIDEDVDNYVIPSVGQNKVIGYASATAKSNADARRGNLNLQETTAVDNGMQLVWDFATSEANGTISCVCLTSNGGGRNCYSPKPYIYNSYSGLQKTFGTVLGQDFENNCFFAVKDKKLLKCKFKPSQVKLNKLFGEPEIIEDYGELTLEGLGNVDSYKKNLGVLNSNTLYYASAPYTSRLKTTVKYFDVATGKNTQSIDVNANGEEIDACSYVKGIITGGYWILRKRNDSKLYKINMTNPSDVQLVDLTGNSLSDYMRVIPNGDVVNNAVILDPSSGVLDVAFEASSQTENDASYLFSDGYVYTGTQGFGVNDLMLMTINNLQTPVTKTADKTMKITYTLLYSE